MHDLVCFHCQQAAEKYLKSILNEQGLAVPRTQNLEDLLGLLLPSEPQLWALRPGLKILGRYAVEARYPGFSTSKRQAASALRRAGQVRDACRTVLPLRPPRSRPRRSP
jgi:HEPN domain-containing protein